MKRFTLLIALIVLAALPACSSDSTIALYNRGRYTEVLKRLPASPGNTRDAFLRARALFETDRFAEAAQAFRPLLNHSTLGPVSRYHLGKSLISDGKTGEGIRILKPLFDMQWKGLYPVRALSLAASTAFKKKRYRDLSAVSTAALKRFPDNRYYLRMALTAARQTKQTTRARALAWRILQSGVYGKDNRTALRTVGSAVPASPGKQRIFIEALIRAGQHGRAIRLLTRKRFDADDLETGLNLAWAYRLRRRFADAERILDRLGKRWADKPRQLRRIRVSRFRLTLGRGQFRRALSIIRTIPDNRHLLRSFSRTVARSSLWTRKINIFALSRYPEDTRFQKALFSLLIGHWNSGKYGPLLDQYDTMHKYLSRSDLASGAAFFAARAALRMNRRKRAAELAGRVILAEPYGYYHSQLRRALPEIRPAIQAIRGKSLRAACLNLLFTGKGPAPDRIRRLWDSSPVKESLALRTPLRNLVEKPDRPLFAWFRENGLHRDAFHLLYVSLNRQGKRYHTLPVRYLAAAADLARLGGGYRSWFFSIRELLRRKGWGLEICTLADRVKPFPDLLRIYPRFFSGQIRRWSRKYNIDPDFVYALTRQESAFQHRVTSWAGARGLMQIMPLTGMNIAADMKLRQADLLDPEVNIRIGTSFLGWLKRAYRHPAEILIGYNAGPGRIRQWKRRYRARYRKWDRWGFIETIPFRETRGYVKVVLANLFAYRTIAAD